MTEETEAQKKKRLAVEAKEEKQRLADEAAALAAEPEAETKINLICTSYHEDNDSKGNKVCYHKNDVIEGLTEAKAFALVQRKKAIYAPIDTAE